MALEVHENFELIYWRCYIASVGRKFQNNDYKIRKLLSSKGVVLREVISKLIFLATEVCDLLVRSFEDTSFISFSDLNVSKVIGFCLFHFQGRAIWFLYESFISESKTFTRNLKKLFLTLSVPKQ